VSTFFIKLKQHLIIYYSLAVLSGGRALNADSGFEKQYHGNRRGVDDEDKADMKDLREEMNKLMIQSMDVLKSVGVSLPEEI
jgi:hypothetical protein